MGSAADLLGSCLRAAGATRVFGSSASGVTGIPGLGHVLVDDADHATILAAAAGFVGPGPGVALLEGRRLLLTSAPGRVPSRAQLREPGEIPALIASWDQGVAAAAVEVQLDLDLDDPAPGDVEPMGRDDQAATAAMTLGEDVRQAGIAVVGGIGVASAGRVGDLVALAAAAEVPVHLTVGAAGALGNPPGAVVGLQERDLQASGVADAAVVVAAGVDTEAVRLEEAVGGQVLDVPPEQLVTLGMRWPQGSGSSQPPLSPLADVVSDGLAGLAGQRSVESPVAAAGALAAAAGGDSLVAADAGPGALWLARAGVPPTAGTLVLPEEKAPGFALAAAALAALDGRPGFAVMTEPLDEMNASLLERVAGWGGPLVVLRWGADAPAVDAEDHARALRAARRSTVPEELAVPVDLSQTRSLVEALGPVTAWTAATEAAAR